MPCGGSAAFSSGDERDRPRDGAINRSFAETQCQHGIDRRDTMRKYIAHLVQGANGPLSCECTDLITCGNCVQVNLMLMEKKFRANDDAVKLFISHVRKNGLRQTAREMGLDKNSLSRWIKTGNMPASVIERYLESQAA
jgi:hypothetical protein